MNPGENMKRNYIYIILVVSLLFNFGSCSTTATPSKSYMPITQVYDPQALEQITTTFEMSEKINFGFFGVMSIIAAVVGCYIMANPGPGFEREALVIGSVTAGAGLGLALIQDLGINGGKAQRINMAAREALLAAAKQRHPEEDVDVRSVSVEYVRQLGKTHMYSATGIAIRKEF